MVAINEAGLDNVYRNAIANVKQVILDNQYSECGVRFREIYENDEDNPMPQSVAIEIEGHEQELRSWVGRRKANYLLDISIAVWYYHEELKPETRKHDIDDMLWKISAMFMQHATINGFVPGLASEVDDVGYEERTKGNRVLAGGYVKLVLHKLHSITNVD